MNWFIKISNSETNKMHYIGNCVDCLNDDWFADNIANDATQLSNIVYDDNNIELSIDKFLEICDIKNNIIKDLYKCKFFINNKNKIIFAYDEDSDIHYFFK